MAYSDPFTSAQLQGISSEDPLSATVNFAGYRAWIITNSTPATFLIYDDNEIVQGKVDPWSRGQGSVSGSTATITLVADYTWPQTNPQGVAATQYKLALESYQTDLAPSAVMLAVSNAIPNIILNEQGQALISVEGGTIDVTQAAGDVLNVGGTIEVGNSTLNVTTATGDSVTVAGTIDIGNTPAVTVDSGTVAISSGTVDIGTAPDLTIAGGTIDVTQAAGDVLNVGGTIEVGNSTLNVTTATGDSVTVAGTIDIGNTPAVTVSSGSVAVTSGTVDATIQNATLDTQSTVINDYVTNNPFVTSSTQNMGTQTIAAGAGYGFMMAVPAGVYDACLLALWYNGGANGLSGITFEVNQIRYQIEGQPSTFYSLNQNFSFPYNNDNSNQQNVSALLPWNGEYLCNYIYIYMTNTNSTSVTVNFDFTLFLRYASLQLTNDVSQPVVTTINTVQPQQSPGLPQTGSYDLAGTDQASVVVQAIDQYFSTIFCSVYNPTGYVLQVEFYNGSSTSAPAWMTFYVGPNSVWDPQLQFPFGYQATSSLSSNEMTINMTWVGGNGTGTIYWAFAPATIAWPTNRTAETIN